MIFNLSVEINDENDFVLMKEFISITGATVVSVDTEQFNDDNEIKTWDASSVIDESNKLKSKYPFDTISAVGCGFEIPDNVKTSTMRVLASRWNTDNKASGKRFSVFSEQRIVVRVK